MDGFPLDMKIKDMNLMDLRTFAVTVILLPALYACSHSNEKWENNPENDRIVHVSGTIANLSPRDVRIALVGTDVVQAAIITPSR